MSTTPRTDAIESNEHHAEWELTFLYENLCRELEEELQETREAYENYNLLKTRPFSELF